MRKARVRAWALVAVEGAGLVPEGTRIHYRHRPPTSGAHWPRPAPWGVSDDPLPPELVSAPDPTLKSRLALLAWDWIDELPEFDRAEILRFDEAHVDRGPEDVP